MTGHSALAIRPSQLPRGYKQTEVGVMVSSAKLRVESGELRMKRHAL